MPIIVKVLVVLYLIILHASDFIIFILLLEMKHFVLLLLMTLKLLRMVEYTENSIQSLLKLISVGRTRYNHLSILDLLFMALIETCLLSELVF